MIFLHIIQPDLHQARYNVKKSKNTTSGGICSGLEEIQIIEIFLNMNVELRTAPIFISNAGQFLYAEN
jgi:hypothetical protein